MKKILIVDDLKTFIEKEKSILSRADFQIFTATSSEDALKIHKREQVDLIITDLDMPGIGGDKLCTLLRKDEELKKVSVLVVCSANTRDLNRVAQCGASAFITKPIRPIEFLQKVGQILDVPERKSYRVILKVTVNGKAKEDSFFCSSRDISASGMLIETEKTLEKGDNISCSFFLPNSEKIATDAEVMRVVSSESGHQYGVRYVDIDPKYRMAIENFILKRSPKKLH